MPRVLRQDGFRCRWPVAQRPMRPHRVVLHSPWLDHHLRLLQRVADLPVQAFIPQLPMEALAIAVLPGTAGFEVQRLGSHGRPPLPQLQGHELGSMVRAQVFGYSVLQHHVRQRFAPIVTVQPSGNSQCQTPPGVLVGQPQQAKGTSVVGEGADKVVAPHLVLMLGTKPHARTVVSPQPASRLLLRRYFQPFPPPDTPYPAPSHVPARSRPPRRDPEIALTALLAPHLHHRSPQPVFLVARGRAVSLRPSPLPQPPARTPLRQPMLLPGMLSRASAPFRA